MLEVEIVDGELPSRKLYYLFSSCNPSNYCKKLPPEAILGVSVVVGRIAALKVSVFVILNGVRLSLTEVKIAGDVELFSGVDVVVYVVHILVSGVPT